MTAGKLSERERATLADFTAALSRACGANLKSVILYGSAAAGDFVPGKSDLNLLVVLKDAGIASLQPLIDILKKPAMSAVNPVFFGESDVAASLDVFPIEFLDMGENYEVLVGEDTLRSLDIDRRNLRFQVEQELKSRILKIRTVYVRCTARNDAAALLASAAGAVVPILRNALRLKDAAVPRNKEEVITLAASFFSINAQPLLDALKTRRENSRKDVADSRANLAALVSELELLAGRIDKL